TWVLAHVGASKVRDPVDAFLVNEVRSWGTSGKLIADETAAPVHGPGRVEGGAAGTDTDGDGIPDEAELRLGANPAVADSMQMNAKNPGYTNIEVWANSLVPSSY